MFCPHCGSSTVDAHGVCQACGKETFDSSTDLEVHAISVGTAGNCLKCGAPLEPDELFCGQCGAPVSSAAPGSGPSLADSLATRASIPQKTRGRLSGPASVPISGPASAPLDDWGNVAPDDYDAPTEAYRRPPTPRPPLRTSPTAGLPSRGMTYRPGSTALRASGPYVEPAPRSQAALVIGLLCFLASFLTGGAAIWLALTSH